MGFYWDFSVYFRNTFLEMCMIDLTNLVFYTQEQDPDYIPPPSLQPPKTPEYNTIPLKHYSPLAWSRGNVPYRQAAMCASATIYDREGRKRENMVSKRKVIDAIDNAGEAVRNKLAGQEITGAYKSLFIVKVYIKRYATVSFTRKFELSVTLNK